MKWKDRNSINSTIYFKKKHSIELGRIGRHQKTLPNKIEGFSL